MKISVKKVKRKKMHVIKCAYVVWGLTERQKVWACFGVSWPLPQQPLPAERQWEVHRVNPGVTLPTVPREFHPRLWSPGSLKPCASIHTPTFLPLLHSAIHLPYKRSLFWFRDLYSHKRTGNAWTTTSKKCCSGFAMSNSQMASEDHIERQSSLT